MLVVDLDTVLTTRLTYYIVTCLALSCPLHNGSRASHFAVQDFATTTETLNELS
jgi:hypothetical protein